MRSSDPATMTAAERLAEIAEILASGYQRLVAAESKRHQETQNRQNLLAAVGAAEAPSCSMVQNPKSTEAPR